MFGTVNIENFFACLFLIFKTGYKDFDKFQAVIYMLKKEEYIAK